MNVAVQKVAGSKELAQVAACALVRLFQSSAEDRSRLSVALAGGSTPKGLYEYVARPDVASRFPWDRVHVFWGDERHVPPDHPDSNYRMAYETLLSKVSVPPSHIHRIQGELPDATEAAERYEHELQRCVSGDSGGRFGACPRFDLILLGMGADGHTASLFPGTQAIHEAAKLVVAPWIEKFQSYRITMTPVVLNAARHVWFLVCGREKARALQAVLEGPYDPDTYPAQIVRPADGRVTWWVDEAAASLLARTACLPAHSHESLR